MVIDIPMTAAAKGRGTAEQSRSALDAAYTGFDRRHRDGVRRFLFRLEADHAMVEDVLQEAFLATREKWADVRDYEKPVAWVIAVARKKLADHQKARGRRGTVPLDEEQVQRHAPADAREAEELVAGWLRMLPRQHAEVMALSIDGWPDREIARILGFADTTVREYKATARERLQRLAEEAGFNVPAGRRRR